MQVISETWEVHIGKDVYIMSGVEVNVLLNAKEMRFVKFRDVIINPAFVTHMKLINTDAPKLPSPPIRIMTDRGEIEEFK